MARLVDEIAQFGRAGSLEQLGIVAVSGGADSVALLRGLAQAGFHSLNVAHFHHQLRGADADADAEFVRELAAELGLTFRLGTADVRALGGNPEATARQLRYHWLGTVADELGAAWIATGHTANDQAETILHRLLRGTGIQGLRGIATTRPLHTHTKTRIVRPILKATRADVLQYLGELHQPFRTDSTNSDTRLTRNRIRTGLLPLLLRADETMVAKLAKLAELAGECHSAEVEETGRIVSEVELPRAGAHIILPIAKLRELDDAAKLFRFIWQRERWPTDAMTFAHWTRLSQLVVGDYPGGIVLRRKGSVVQLGPRE